ncbi:MAG: protoporphyrinogen oxidase [Streptosporangiales bacterium]|nr:protoporphyrinogen oxidase [Streptosporangiales bacterium]
MSSGPDPSGRRHVVVVGGGVAGLTAAWELTRRDENVRVTLLEASPRVGGKLQVSEVAGVPVDEGAEAMLARRPEGVELVCALGLGDELVEPGTTRAAIWTDTLRPMPTGHVMGVPADLDALASSGLLAPAEVDRVREDERLPATPVIEDVSVGRYVGERMGRAIVDRLVEPLLGGVYAGRADVLSLHATVPQLVPYLRDNGSLVAAARAVTAGAPRTSAPVFASLRGGLGRLPTALASRCGAEIRTSATVRELRLLQGGWSLTVGSPRSPEQVTADAVVLALPARPASRLLAVESPYAAADLAMIEYASTALVTLAFPAGAFPEPPVGSGFLVPASRGRLTKAATFVTTKWPYLAGAGIVVVRCSVGRHGEERSLQVDDDTLAAAVSAELAEAVGVTGPPIETRVTRWGGALPQYAVGHLDLVSRITAAVDRLPGLAVCGAAYQGVGIPACVASARQAVDRVSAALADT